MRSMVSERKVGTMHGDNRHVPQWEVTYVGRQNRATGERPIVVARVHAWSREQAVEQTTTPASWGGSLRDNVCDVRQVTFPGQRVVA